MDTKTTVSVVPKASPTDNDVELTQTYSALINGEKVTAPITYTSQGSSSDGNKGIIQQSIDLQPVVDLAKEAGRREAEKVYKKNWEVSTGLGVHKGDLYIPIGIQRNYAPDKAIAAEVHMDKEGVSGGELKHVWKFK